MLRVIARVLFILIGAVLVLGVALAAVRFVLIPRNFPTLEGTVRLEGLDGPVEVYRDNLGIPHLYASSEHDLLMAQGFVHAQDRFWQMEFQRRIGSGRLSELLGEATLETDRFIRTVGWHRTAAEEVELLEGQDRELLEAYAAGVNAYLELHRGPLGLEFTVLGLIGEPIEPEPWTPLHTLTWGKVMAWDLGGSRRVELARAQIAAKLGAEAVPVLMPPYDPNYPTILAAPPSTAALEAVPPAAYTTVLGATPRGLGSNSWAISGERSATGSPLLANDPHLGIQMPSIWYEIGLHCQPVGPDCGLNVVGASLLGAPGVVIGHNDRLAWGFTNLGPDVVDFFIERQNPENPNQYEYRGRWLDMEVVREVIEVRGRERPEFVDVRITRHGPIINDVAGGTEEEWAFGWEPLAFSWTALEPGTIFKAILMLNRAQNWDQFREALSYFDVPSQNVVYADGEGNIGYQAPGRIPIRAAGDGSMPVPGWTGDYEWVDTIPFEELPSVYNPPEGYVVTANNAVVGSDYPYFLSIDWDEGYRARRIVAALEADNSISMSEVQALQLDVTDLYAQDILPHLLALSPPDQPLRQALDLLQAWDARADRNSAAAALFEAFRVELVEATFKDELGEQLQSQILGELMVATADLLEDPQSEWFDDRHTEAVENRDAILLRALRSAVERLSERLGDDLNRWRWGDLHTATFVNGSLGVSGIDPIERLFNRGPFETDGTIGTVNNIGYAIDDPFGASYLPSYRQIIDLGRLDRSLSIHTTGQSGHPFHPHYDDMIDLWRNGQYHSMLWELEQIEEAAANHLRLIP